MTSTRAPDPAARAPISLDDRYLKEEGTVYLTGVQALVRLAIDQSRRDRRAGLRIGTFASGYPGSPLGSYDMALQRLGANVLERFDIVHVPGGNEELAATAILGTQMLDRYPHSKWDGVTGFWYGKGPGVDRAGDALKHGNFSGTSEHGAVVVLAGEDHEGKSSTMPFQDDYAFMSAAIPILYPASVEEFLELGLHAVALSRYSGCWVALKLVGALCDGGATIEVRPDAPKVVLPDLMIGGRPFKKKSDFVFFPGTNIQQERHIHHERHVAVRAYARANRLDRIEVHGPQDRLGIVTAGKSFGDTRQALTDLGLSDEVLRAAGVRLLKMGLIYPIDPAIVREFAEGLDRIVVVEEKRGVLEAQIKEALCGIGRPIAVVGKLDERGEELFPLHGGLDSDLVAERLAPRLIPLLDDLARRRVLDRMAAIEGVRGRRYQTHPGRTPNYCSGCPHNFSTVLEPGQLAWGSPGCHSFATIMEPKRHIEAMTQYGGEGLPWVGLSRFTDRPHMIQNVGDGSLFHSSYLNIRFCVAAGATITFRILYNGAIANTGAQELVGAKSIPTLSRLLTDEGVARIAILTKDPSQYQREPLGLVARVYPPEDYPRVLREFSETQGVTVAIYDETCANERRRRQKRGLVPTSTRFVVINEEVCEHCGNCGEVTNCMSLQTVDTAFGPKTRVHESTCNQDHTCLQGDCPSFLTVDVAPGTGYVKTRPATLEASAIPEPLDRPQVDRPFRIYLPGVGGTGVITINALLAWAGLMDGYQVQSYDQTGAAQKWGPVLSSLVLARAGSEVGANKVPMAAADLYLALDPLAAASAFNLDRCDPGRTRALIATSALPTGEMVRNVDLTLDSCAIQETIAAVTRADQTLMVDVRRVSEGLFRDHMLTNLFAVGVAYQAGFLPLSSASIEHAVRLNGVEVDGNLQAFRYGRLYQHDRERVERLVTPNQSAEEAALERALAGLSQADRRIFDDLMAGSGDLPEGVKDVVALRTAELFDYQNAAYARRYHDRVSRAAERERSATGQVGPVTAGVARGLYSLLAIKDEYEVARLHLKPSLRSETERLFERPVRVSYHFHPPALRRMGLKKKLELGPWFTPVLRGLKGWRRFRGTLLDPFRFGAHRRLERSLASWYEDLIATALVKLRKDNVATVAAIAGVPDQIRGYEGIKERNVLAAQERAAELLAQLDSGTKPGR